MTSKSLATVLLVAGAVVLVFTVSTFPHGGQNGYAHEVTEANDPDLHPAQELTSFDHLSSQAQNAFRAALRNDDGTYVVYDDEKAAPEFSYGDEGGVAYVSYENSVYVLETNGRSGIGMLDQILYYGGVVLSAGLLLGGTLIGIPDWKSVFELP